MFSSTLEALYLAGGDCLATLARRQAAQHFEVLQQQQEASHCGLPAIQLASRESYVRRTVFLITDKLSNVLAKA